MTATITRNELTEAVYQQLGLSRSESSDLVETCLEEIIQALILDESVKLSSFGTFSTRYKNERVGRNPKTGIEVPITPRRVVSFKASNVLKDKILQNAA
jgi:integration host factor subunit alpha